ncbi:MULTISPECIES: HlyD family type I secretion periplasmic adaptor subunit [Photobacterium]|uniref:Membrane fusion protein (MFP) family protein n=1 Tax=Photobacterium halotolerans TaxID=265726 RepID=A0A0F5VDH3_9GAMM|nr:MULTISPECIES: HlyD family type I secretion periplasmic adaptor subunit [Photobacterium]KKD00216.1 hemolysin secretion protein D [Photobacterium halotolerans]UIP30296.1 HlyD family type I secretion periplasmic adaptor subunit [Photobacterium sp. TLY01]
MKTPSVDRKHLDFVDDKTAALLLNTPGSARVMLWVIVIFFIVAGVWASRAQLEQVTTGNGKVIPSSQLQVVQNLEGGIVKALMVKEGEQVLKNQPLLLIDDTRFQSDFNERAQELASAQADAIRLDALLDNVSVNQKNKAVSVSRTPLVFPDTFLSAYPDLVKRQQAEYSDNLSTLESQLAVAAQQIQQKQQELVEARSRLSGQRQGYNLASREYKITKPLADEGVVPEIELLKLQRQLNDTRKDMRSTELQIPVIQAAIREAELKRLDVALKFRSDIQADLNQATAKRDALNQSSVGLEDKVERTLVRSPVNGTVQTLYVNTIGGVIQPGMDIVAIVPTEDNLVIEAKVLPQDIGFLRPGLKAMIKFSAYDYTVYGGLEGTLEQISADTIQDEEGNSFYQVKIRTEKNNLADNSGEQLPIIPGMTASADIITGKRTVLQYLLNPILKASNSALRE